MPGMRDNQTHGIAGAHRAFFFQQLVDQPAIRAIFSKSTPDSGSSSNIRSGRCASNCISSLRLISPPEKTVVNIPVEEIQQVGAARPG